MPTTPPPADPRRMLLALTAEQHGIKRRIDLIRADLDERARTEHAETGVAPTWKIKGLGSIALEGVEAEATAYVADEAAFESYMAERFPSESAGLISLPAHLLADALEVLRFAQIDVTVATTVMTSNTTANSVLGGVTLVRDEDKQAWEAWDADGVQVPGVSGRIATAPRLVVRVDAKAKAAASDAADADYAAMTAETDTTEAKGA